MLHVTGTEEKIRNQALTAAHLFGGVAARSADLLLLVEGGATAPPAGRVGLVMPLTKRGRSLRLLAGQTYGDDTEKNKCC